MEDPVVSIIIVNFNGQKHLEKGLPSLMATSNITFEVIVVDNASSDNSLPFLEKNYPEVKVIPLKKNLGFGRANTIGVQSSCGEKIAFLNNDTVVTENWLFALNKLIDSNPEITAACSVLKLLQFPELLNAIGGGITRLGYGFDHFFLFSQNHPFLPPSPHNPGSIPVLFPTAAAMLISKENFLKIGGFDKAIFMYHEDVDLGWRIWLMGGEVHVCTDSVVYHYFGGTTSIEQTSQFRDTMGMRHNVRTLLKCYSKKHLPQIMNRIFRVLIHSRNFPFILNVIVWNLVHLPSTIVERIKIQTTRLITDEELFEKELILNSDYPVPCPMRPFFTLEQIKKYAVHSLMLDMSQETAIGRLGPGWYSLETIGEAKCRWTSGHGVCYLKVSPSCKGTVKIRLFPPGTPFLEENIWVKVIANNMEFRKTYDVQTNWQDIEIDVQSDEYGLIKISLFSSVWSPDNQFNNKDCRWLGCAVKTIRFSPEKDKKNSQVLHGTNDNSLSIIIPTYNRFNVLLRTLKALNKQTVHNFEVIVVDDGSSDNTFENIKKWLNTSSLNYHIKLLQQKNQKQGQARNYGLKTAKGEIILFIGDDIIPEPDFVKTHIDGHAEFDNAEDVAILGYTNWDKNQMKVTPFLDFINHDGAQFGYGYLRENQITPFTCFYTSNISIRKSILGKQPFNPAFNVYGWEDTDVGYRLCLQGLRIIYKPKAKALHYHPMSLKTFLKRQEQVGNAIHYFISLHPELINLSVMPSPAVPKCYRIVSPFWNSIKPLIDILDNKSKTPWTDSFYRWLLSVSFTKGWKKRADPEHQKESINV